jgi:hypothetical protein
MYFICLQMKMLPGSNLFSITHLPAFSGFIILRKRDGRKGPRCHFSCCGSTLISFCLPSSAAVIMMLGRVALFIYLTSELIRVTLCSGTSIP